MPYWRKCLLSQPEIWNHIICSWVKTENWNAPNSKVLILRRMLSESHSQCMWHTLNYILWSLMLFIETCVTCERCNCCGSLWNLILLHPWFHDLNYLDSQNSRMLVIEDTSKTPPPHLPDRKTQAKTWEMSCLRPCSKILNFWHENASPYTSNPGLFLCTTITYSRGTIINWELVFANCTFQ